MAEKGGGIVIIQKTKPEECGGTDATLDTNAPKQIVSDKMVFFYATSALNSWGLPSETVNSRLGPLGLVSAFAAPSGEGTFLFLETSSGPRRYDNVKRSWALVKKDVFPSLVALVDESDIIKDNGYHSKTHGLPEDFGGSVKIVYESGEKISFSNNQTPVFRYEFGRKVAELFDEAMSGERVPLPDVSELSSIVYEENGSGGSFTKAHLTIGPDGKGINEKKTRYSDPHVYESTKEVDAKTIEEIKEKIAEKGILAWAGLPKKEFTFGAQKKMTFVFGDGTKITVPGDRCLPDQISGGFFDIELEIVTKH